MCACPTPAQRRFLPTESYTPIKDEGSCSAVDVLVECNSRLIKRGPRHGNFYAEGLHRQLVQNIRICALDAHWWPEQGNDAA